MPRVDVPDKVAGRRRFLHDLPARTGCCSAASCGRPRAAPSCCRWTSRPPAGCPASSPSSRGRLVPGRRRRAGGERAAGAGGLCARRRWVAGGSDTLPDERRPPRLPGSPRPRRRTVLAETEAQTRPAARSVRARVHPALSRARVHRAVRAGFALWGTAAGWRCGRTRRACTSCTPRSAACAGAGARGRRRSSTSEGAGCYGHNAADDAAYDAVLLARAVPGRPVQVRLDAVRDELGWGPLGPAMVIDVEVELDETGGVAALAARRLEQRATRTAPGPPSAPTARGHARRGRRDGRSPRVTHPLPPTAGDRAATPFPLYDLPGQLRAHLPPADGRWPLRTSALRALGAHLNVYAIESVVDELAELAGARPGRVYRLGAARRRAGTRGAARPPPSAPGGGAACPTSAPAPGSASVSRATRTRVRTARWWPRWRRRRTSGCAG